jgi:RNA polymerase sigma-70 factor, ECF subfamily
MDEKQAIIQLKADNLAGLETLVKLHQVKALRTACLITGDLAAAEDVVQEAFLKVHKHIDQYDDRFSFSNWFTRIVINQSLKYLIRQKRTVSLDDEHSSLTIDLAETAPLPEKLLEGKETLQLLREAINRLPPAERATFVMRYYLQMPEKEIAETLHGSLGTIKWWAYSARKKLKANLSPAQSDTNTVNDYDHGEGRSK